MHNEVYLLILVSSEKMVIYGNLEDYLHISSKGNVSRPCYAMVCQLAREMRRREAEPHLALVLEF